MRKENEIGLKSSCFNKATLDEYIFILLGRDLATPATIRYWCSHRIAIGKNIANDQQITEALILATEIELQQTKERIMLASNSKKKRHALNRRIKMLTP